MRRLKNVHRGDRAVVVLGGPSLIEQRFAFDRLRGKGFVTFLESKALTPAFLGTGVEPDYFLMLFPEKCSSNGFHNFVFRSFLAQYRGMGRLVRPQFLPALRDMQEHFDEYFEPWRPHRGAHKRYRWRADVELKDSPVALLEHLPRTKILANDSLMATYFPKFRHANERYVFDQPSESQPFDRDTYYTVRDDGERVTVENFGFYNSAAIVLYPLLRYMGFRTVYFVGMDMSMLGTMEYAAPYTFRSMLHYRWFFQRTKHSFNAAYRQNRPWYIRPQSEFEDLRALLDPARLELVRVFDPYPYTTPIPFMPSISTAEFWRL
jgi:hypothetical protein